MIAALLVFLSQVGVFLQSFFVAGEFFNPARPYNSMEPFSQCSDFVFVGGNVSNKVFEKVGGTWVEWSPGTVSGFYPNEQRYAASLDGLAVAFLSTDGNANKKVLLYKRASTDVSFSTSTTTVLSLPSLNYGVWQSLRMNDTCTRIVVGDPYAGVTAGEARGRIATFIWDGATWVVSSLDGAPGSHFGGRLSLSPGGTRLAVQQFLGSVGDVRVFVYSGFPSAPWEEVTPIPSSGKTLVSWLTDISFVVANDTNIRIYGRQVASNDWVLSHTVSNSSLGLVNVFDDAGPNTAEWVPGPPQFIGLSGPTYLELIRLDGANTHKMGVEQIRMGCLSYTGRTVFRAAQYGLAAGGLYIYER